MDISLKGLNSRILRGGISLSFSRLLNRSFDVIRMITIARWLGPDEMGIYAVAAIVLNALEQFTETGLRAALIQRQGDITHYILPVRTVQVVRGLFLGLIVYCSAPWVANFFKSTKSVEVLQVIAFLPIIRGFEPLFTTLAQKELRFAPVVALQSIAAFISLVIGVIVAYFHPDAWALVISSISGAVITTIGAYFLSERKNWGFSYNWKPLKQINGFGYWIFLSYMIAYIFTKGGDWMIGRLLDVRTLALYQMAFLISTTATTEIGIVVSQITFPVFSHLQTDRQRLISVFRQSFGIISLITHAMAGLVLVCSPDFYNLVLGYSWLAALPFVPWLTIWGVCSIFSGIINGVFYAINQPKLWTQTTLYMVVLLSIGIYPMILWLGALGVAVLMSCIGVSMQLVRYRIISELLVLPFIQVLRLVFVPIIACIISSTFTIWMRSILSIVNPLIGLLFCALCFQCIYIFFLMIGHKWIEPSPKELSQSLRSLFRRSESVEPLLSVKG